MLEPLDALFSQSHILIKQLKGLQDALGQLHDLHTLDERLCDLIYMEAQLWAKMLISANDETQPDHCYALAALLAYVREQNQKHVTELQIEWDGQKLELEQGFGNLEAALTHSAAVLA